MNQNSDKPARFAGQRREKKWRSALVRLQNRLRPITVSWLINILAGVTILFIITFPREKPVQNVYASPPGKEGIIMTRDLALPRDVENIPNFRVMDKEKEEARNETRPVYDWDPQVGKKARNQVKEFFQSLRELYPPPPEPADGSTAEQAARAEEGPDRENGRTQSTVPDPEADSKAEELLEKFSVGLEPAEMEKLKKRHFAPRLEKAVLGLINTVYPPDEESFLVANKKLLRKESRGKGINAAMINPASEKSSHTILEADTIKDMEKARQSIRDRAEEKLSDMDPALRQVLVKMAEDFLDPNLHFNKDKTEEAKASAVAQVKTSYKKYWKGEVPYRKGERVVDPFKIKTIDAILEELQGEPGMRVYESAATFIIIILFFASVMTFGKMNIRKFQVSPKDMFFLALVLVVSLAALKGVNLLAKTALFNMEGVPDGLNFHYLIALAGAAMLVRMVMNSEIALCFALAVAALGGMVVEDSLLFFFYTMIGSVIAAGEVKQCRQRSTILRAGLILGLVNVLLILVISFINFGFLDQKALLINSVFGLAGGIFAAIIVTGVVPVAESVFNYATDIKLLELLNQDEPLLKNLSMRAPGTHQHSMMVGNLAEAAAKAIGANPLLTRVCAMYHDVGKMNKPHYFAENQWDGNNVHDRLSPSMSTLIIHNHVKEGVEMAHKHKMPKVVIDAIKEHHGTSLVQFFYEKAKEQNETGVPMDEVDFRYPGPKPQTRETAIIMLADVVESAGRSLQDPSPSRLKGMVQKLINRFFIDGQLDECELTLKDLHVIARSFNNSLGAIYHHRPDYPASAFKKAQTEKPRKTEKNADKHKDKEPEKTQDQQDQDKEQSENYLKRLGM
ncbi:MAG: HDIG domain-containing protein [bacterium]